MTPFSANPRPTASAAPAGPSKNELKKAAKKAEKERLAMEKAAKAKERQEAQAAAEAVGRFLLSNFYVLDHDDVCDVGLCHRKL